MEQALEELQAKQVVKNYMWWSMGAGLIPVPFIDLAAVSGVQLKMLKDISELYGIEFSQNKGKSIVTALIGSVVPNSLSFGMVGSMLKAIPGIGTVLGTASFSIFAGAATYAIGKVFIQHFESGGTFLNFNPTEVKEYFAELYKEGQNIAKDMKADKEVKEEKEIKK